MGQANESNQTLTDMLYHISPVVSFQTEILSEDSVYKDLDPLASVWVSAFDIALHM